MQKVRFRYRVSILNENTLEESWFIRLSRFSVFIYLSFFILLTFLILASIIVFTPLRYYLPGYGGSEDRISMIQESMQVDSILNQMELQSQYMEVMKAVITGDLAFDSVYTNDSLPLRERAELLVEKSKSEKNFVDKYERDEKYNLSSLASTENTKILVFFKPTKGVITSNYSLQDKNYGINILTSPHEAVVSVLNGTIVHASYSFKQGGVVVIQHDDGYVSIYQQNTQILKKVGDAVRAGEVIAFTGEENGSNEKEQFYFELWKQGTPVNPEELIIF